MSTVTQESLKTAIERLHYWQYGKEPTNFTSMLYLMFQKADPENYRLLAQSYPAEAMAHQMWMASPDQDEFFKQWDLRPGETRNHATTAQKEKDLIDLLAEVEHAQWVSWSQELANDEILSEERVARWRKCWVPYKELSEDLKISDRFWAEKMLARIKVVFGDSRFV